MAKTTIRKRAYGETREIRDQEWLRLNQEGKSTSAIAEDAGVSVQLVRRALARSREQEASRIQDDAANAILPFRDAVAGDEETPPPSPATPRTPWWLELVPLFPIDSFTPASKCPHHGPIKPGSLFCCMVCSKSGIDDHPAMKRDPGTDPKPEPTSSTAPGRNRREVVAIPLSPESRRERRARRFAGIPPRNIDPADARSILPSLTYVPYESRISNQGDSPCRSRESA
ncbi:helix-turn-helix domain-containing protein [Planctomyces sp. SH-PL62]|uniref:helix-turn-helix domain-containing protein n=1 Tax=Planctomyces sp. SH-PL62 TaxID=1636152 RepID=UPI00078E659D|nr:helix-turn-helix domain-containing protein [Planctomyces sp. SH-PL62]AMV37348.1 hypothetical protein VT85_07935 [Planctomyces sp. SH-PL62]